MARKEARKPHGRPGRARSGRRGTVWTALAALAAIVVLVIFAVARSVPRSGGRLAAASTFPFPCLGTEGEAQHIHPYLRTFVNGAPVIVPAYIGIREQPDGSACFEPVHTHDSSGIIHIESPSPTRQYTLGDVFAVWRATYRTAEVHGVEAPVVYTASNLFGHVADAHHAVRLLVDGVPSHAGPGLVLNRLDYCTAAMTSPPCFPTAVANPFPPPLARAYGTGHTIVLEYASGRAP